MIKDRLSFINTIGIFIIILFSSYQLFLAPGGHVTKDSLESLAKTADSLAETSKSLAATAQRQYEWSRSMEEKMKNSNKDRERTYEDILKTWGYHDNSELYSANDFYNDWMRTKNKGERRGELPPDPNRNQPPE